MLNSKGSPTGLIPVLRYVSIESAAFLPPAIASIAVAAPVTQSPPEKMKSLWVVPVSVFALMVSRELTSWGLVIPERSVLCPIADMR